MNCGTSRKFKSVASDAMTPVSSRRSSNILSASSSAARFSIEGWEGFRRGLEEKGEEDERRRKGFWLDFLVFLIREECAAVIFMDILRGERVWAFREPNAPMMDAKAFLSLPEEMNKCFS